MSNPKIAASCPVISISSCIVSALWTRADECECVTLQLHCRGRERELQCRRCCWSKTHRFACLPACQLPCSLLLCIISLPFSSHSLPILSPHSPHSAPKRVEQLVCSSSSSSSFSLSLLPSLFQSVCLQQQKQQQQQQK